jgi:hypothetical protein
MRWCSSKDELRFDEFSDSWRLAARQVTPLDRAREQQALRIYSSGRAVMRHHSRPVSNNSRPCSRRIAAGRVRSVYVMRASRRVRRSNSVMPGACVRVAELLEALERLVGAEQLRVVYGPPPGLTGGAFGAPG